MNQVRIETTLQKLFPNAETELNFENNYQLLISVVLSAQTKDVSVNKVTKILFNKYKNYRELSSAKLNDVESILKTIGLYKTKARNIISLSKKVVSLHNSNTPRSREDLENLPGVGRKTANVVLSNGFNIPAIAVDTHVQRVYKRLGIADFKDNIYIVEKKLMNYFPKNKWKTVHNQMIFFGRYHCKSMNPNCTNCPFYDFCKYDKKIKPIDKE